jgi:hypothetical protein
MLNKLEIVSRLVHWDQEKMYDEKTDIKKTCCTSINISFVGQQYD